MQCSMDECTRPVKKNARKYGWCETHYWRWYRTGDPHGSGKAIRGTSLAERVKHHRGETDENGCIPWAGTVDVYGYGVLSHNNDQWKAHRAAWVVAGLELTDGMTLDHLCRNKICVNVKHMEEVTFGTNASRARRKLTDEQVREIRVRAAKGEESQRKIAEDYSTTQAAVSLIHLGKSYRHVT